MTARKTAAFVIRALRPVRAALFPPACRFHPSCSRYAEEAVLSLGVLGAVLPVAGRLAKCHPFHPGGFDPVPQRSIPSPHG
ncbi:MAG: membrane protein insertion efficiency factor YidD [Elusimicrobia bacterium]|nr:membrane protein insertion efficiency factor YidD [Elusimicrobiota bacterium]